MNAGVDNFPGADKPLDPIYFKLKIIYGNVSMRPEDVMMIEIVGGGPAGLYFALLMKKADISHKFKLY